MNDTSEEHTSEGEQSSSSVLGLETVGTVLWSMTAWLSFVVFEIVLPWRSVAAHGAYVVVALAVGLLITLQIRKSLTRPPGGGQRV